MNFCHTQQLAVEIFSSSSTSEVRTALFIIESLSSLMIIALQCVSFLFSLVLLGALNLSSVDCFEMHFKVAFALSEQNKKKTEEE
jgi:hypothetical protein